MWTYIWIGVGGSLGAVARHALGQFVLARFSTSFPLGTLLANVSGAFLLGFLVAGGARATAWPTTTRLAVTVGFLGAYTTFSTWSVETLQLLEAGRVGLALANILGSVAAGLLGAWAGQQLARAA